MTVAVMRVVWTSCSITRGIDLRFQEQHIENDDTCSGGLQSMHHGAKLLPTPWPAAELGNALVVNCHQHHLCARGRHASGSGNRGLRFQSTPELRLCDSQGEEHHAQRDQETHHAR